MKEQDTINLLRTKSDSPELEYWASRLRVAGYIGVAGLLVIGLLLGGGYLILRRETNSLEDKKSVLITRINQERTKEGLLLSLKQRIGLASKVGETQRSLGTVLDTINRIAETDQLVAITRDEKQQIRIIVKTKSVEEAAGVIANVLRMVAAKRVINPQLVGLDLGSDGSVRVTVAFVHSS
ncbi:hypothetical protein HY948_05305 [Candidatus Gottesmanbacteria bacterium]|nr:hypothetical protein [Candidatus Gottesmanbacteria bacterium]